MNGIRSHLLFSALITCVVAPVSASSAERQLPSSDMSLVPGGIYASPFRDPADDAGGDTARVRVALDPFRLDERAVTTAEYIAFLKENPRYTRARIPRMFADTGYLRAWKDDLRPDLRSLHSPVTAVSWHAAKAYCAAQGKRLPTTAEWEHAAALPAQASDSADYERVILEWYARSAAEGLPVSGSGTRHAHGIRDLHGVVWEWTADYNAWNGAGVARRGRSDDSDDGLFCGGAPARMVPNTSYAVYMRWAFRASLEPDYTVGTLGFRCARDAPPGEEP